ncbi:MAG: lysophospholipid acyltransferase family protein [Kistimonas sp.]|nr:lysophospholipid acyltransferase family protein [Kistimonas sp.]
MIRTGCCALRSFLFYVLWILYGVPWCLWVILAAPCTRSVQARHRYLAQPFCRMTVVLCRLCCGIRWALEGAEHITARPCVIVSNHQSPWETFFLQTLASPQTTVIKKELLQIPFFGWAFRVLDPIPIDRKEAHSSLQQVVKAGKKSLERNQWVMIFPEGSRHPWPETGRFNRGAAFTAQAAGAPVVPVVHDAGRYWPSGRWIKRPGTVRVKVGPALDSQASSAAELTQQLREWIQENKNRD